MIRVPAVRKAIISDKRAWFSLSLGMALVAAATAIRWALSSLGVTLTFVTYFPAVLICGLLCGWRYGAACALIAGLIGSGLFPRSPTVSSLSATDFANLITFWVSAAVVVATADALKRAVRELGDANRRADMLNRELQHRVGNMLTVVQAIAAQSAKGATPQEFYNAFSGRLQALSKAQRLLGKWSPETCAVADLVDVACEPFCDGSNIVKTGPAYLLPAVSCVPLVLALHELCTNAVKYGALSVAEGRVVITWAYCAKAQRLTISWEEVGGPAVVPPARAGLGTRLLRRQPGIAELDLTYEQSGLRCIIGIDEVIPLDLSVPTPVSAISRSGGAQPLPSGSRPAT